MKLLFDLKLILQVRLLVKFVLEFPLEAEFWIEVKILLEVQLIFDPVVNQGSKSSRHQISNLRSNSNSTFNSISTNGNSR